MFDHQINGHGGILFSNNNLTPDDVFRAVAVQYQYGVTRIFPTVITNTFSALAKGFRALRTACESDSSVDMMCPGFHLEGPFISSEEGPRGAHPVEHIRPADWDEFRKLQDIAEGRIRLVTIAPEVEGALEFIRHAAESGVVVSIGHTGGSPEQIRAAVDAGARMSTHLGNGAHNVLPRHPNYIWEQLGDSRLAAGIITDGHHLPPSVIRTVIGTKGVEHTFITCDVSGLAGCKPGRYRFESVEVEVLADGPIVVAGQRKTLAGSGQQTDVCVANVLTFADVTLQQAFDMAGRYPAEFFGLEQIQLQQDSRADLVVFYYAGPGHRLKVLATIAAGDVRYGELFKPT